MTGPGRIERWRSDRKIRTGFYVVATLYWLLMALTSVGWELGLTLAAAACFGLCAVSEIRSWRRSGRQVAPVSTLPPDLTPELRARVSALATDGEQVAAIRLVREETGAGLLAAKRAVDQTVG